MGGSRARARSPNGNGSRRRHPKPAPGGIPGVDMHRGPCSLDRRSTRVSGRAHRGRWSRAGCTVDTDRMRTSMGKRFLGSSGWVAVPGAFCISAPLLRTIHSNRLGDRWRGAGRACAWGFCFVQQLLGVLRGAAVYASINGRGLVLGYGMAINKGSTPLVHKFKFTGLL